MRRPPFIQGIIASGLSLVLAISAFGQSLTNPVSVVNTNPNSWTFTGSGYGTGSATTSFTPPPGTPFTTAYNVNVTTQTSGSSVAVTAPGVATVSTGDALVATIWYQRVDGNAGEANLVASFQQTSSPYTASLAQPLRGRTQWRSVTIPFISGTSGMAQFTVQCGASVQNIMIGGVQVMDYGPQGILSATSSDVNCLNNCALVANGQAFGYTKTMAVTGNPFFTNAWSVEPTSTEKIANGFQSFVQCIPQKPIAANDTLVAIFWLKHDPHNWLNQTGGATDTNDMGISGYDLGTISNGGKVAAYPGAVNCLQVDGNWRQFRIPIKAPQAWVSGTAQFRIWLAGNQQTLDIGAVQIINLGSAVSASSLTNNQYDYPGRNLGDSWRATAQANIQTYRTGTLTVLVEDQNGQPITTGVQVSGSMMKHAFGFGTWVNTSYYDDLNQGASVTRNYQQAISQYPISGASSNVQTIVNTIDLGNYKWPSWVSGTASGSTWTTNDWFRLHGTTDIRGHNLIWPNFYGNGGKDVPSWLPAITGSAAMSGTVMNHIATEISDNTTMSRISDWDVVNEPFSSFDIQQVILGQTPVSNPSVPLAYAQSASVIQGWIEQAYKYEPNANLFINESGVETNLGRFNVVMTDGTSNDVHYEEPYDFALLTQLTSGSYACHLDGWGFESHFGAFDVSPVTEKQIFDKFGAITTLAGVPLQEQVTEYENECPDMNVQADYLSDYLTLVFSEPNFNKFCMYGFCGLDFPEPAPYLGYTPMKTAYGYNFGNVYDAGWNVTLSGEEWLDLIYKNWWTNQTVTSDNTGKATISNAYLGHYAITATYNGVTKTVYADLAKTPQSPNGSTVVLKFSGGNGKHVWVYDAANSAAIYAPLQIAANTGAANGLCLQTTTRVPNPPVSPTQQLRIDTEASGPVTVWLRVTLENLVSGQPDNRLYAQFDSGSWDVPAQWGTYDILHNYSTFTWVKLATPTLTVGTANSINIAPSSLWYGNNLDQVLVTDDPNYLP